MKTNDEYARSPAVMLYDGDCAFCQEWIKRWRKRTGEHIRYLPYQEALSRYPEVSEEDCKKTVQLITPDGSVFSGAHAVLHTLAYANTHHWLLWAYEHLPFFGRMAEVLYRKVAKSRYIFSKLLKKSSTCRVE